MRGAVREARKPRRDRSFRVLLGGRGGRDAGVAAGPLSRRADGARGAARLGSRAPRDQRARSASGPGPCTLPLANAAAGKGLSKLWARRKIADAEVARTLRKRRRSKRPTRRSSRSPSSTSLVTRLTSLVAVDKTPSRPEGARAHPRRRAAEPAGRLGLRQGVRRAAAGRRARAGGRAGDRRVRLRAAEEGRALRRSRRAEEAGADGADCARRRRHGVPCRRPRRMRRFRMILGLALCALALALSGWRPPRLVGRRPSAGGRGSELGNVHALVRRPLLRPGALVAGLALAAGVTLLGQGLLSRPRRCWRRSCSSGPSPRASPRAGRRSPGPGPTPGRWRGSRCRGLGGGDRPRRLERPGARLRARPYRRHAGRRRARHGGLRRPPRHPFRLPRRRPRSATRCGSRDATAIAPLLRCTAPGRPLRRLGPRPARRPAALVLSTCWPLDAQAGSDALCRARRGGRGHGAVPLTAGGARGRRALRARVICSACGEGREFASPRLRRRVDHSVERAERSECGGERLSGVVRKLRRRIGFATSRAFEVEDDEEFAGERHARRPDFGRFPVLWNRCWKTAEVRGRVGRGCGRR